MRYIAIKRARFNSISGLTNIPCGTEVECSDGILTIEGNQLCSNHSQNAYDFFSRNDDGNGLERGKLTQTIRKMLEKRDNGYQERWDKVWADPLCVKYKRQEHADFWIWNYDFYNATIPDLRHIAALVGAKGVS